MFYAASLIVYAFGALTFCVLSAFYWRERWTRGARTRSVLPAFTFVCGALFGVNLLLHTGAVPTGLGLAVRNVAAGLLPALMLHLVVELETEASPWWRRLVASLYVAGLASETLRTADERGLLSTADSDVVYLALPSLLAASTAAGSLLLITSRGAGQPSERWHRRWLAVLLVFMLVCAAGNMAGYGALLGPAPDYIVLAFFCVSLYYRERLVFIDLLLKRGAFLGAGVVFVVAAALLVRDGPDFAPFALALALWVVAPWVYSAAARIIDRRWLRRPYSPAGAERQFIRDIQVAASEDDLRLSAMRSLRAIFQSEAEVCFHDVASRGDALVARFESGGITAGALVLHPRPDGIPFMSDDRRLLQTLAGTFGVVLENVRYRAEQQRQSQREQELRLLATRAELRALRAQINPHFLFNSLSAIAGLIQYQPQLADETIEQLALVFRYALRKAENEWALLAEEVEFVSAYLRVEQARFGRRLSVRLEIDPAAQRVPIPAMSIQPLIENAIRHGISAMESGGTIHLRAVMDGEYLSVEVSDNGPGFPPGFSLDVAGQSHGLRNVSERLNGYYAGAAHFYWESRPDCTRVVMRLPCALATAGVPR